MRLVPQVVLLRVLQELSLVELPEESGMNDVTPGGDSPNRRKTVERKCDFCEAEIPEGEGIVCDNCSLCAACLESAADFCEPADTPASA